MEPGWMRYDLWWNAVLLDLRLRDLVDRIGRLPLGPTLHSAPAPGPAAPAGDEFLVAYA